VNEKTPTSPGRMPFRMGRRYKEVGPELGRLYEAWQLGTGLPALMLLPGDRMDWRPEGVWRFEMSCQLEPLSIELALAQAPASAHVPDLVTVLALMKAAVERAENNPRLWAHFERGSSMPLEKRIPSPRLEPHAWRGQALASGVLFALVLGVCLRDTRRLEQSEGHSPGAMDPAAVPTDAPDVIGPDESQTKVPAYPLPSAPFRNQAAAPCKTRGEVAINGGCWVELAQKPPCYENQAEHQGKCYMPVGKPQGRLPQATEP
jgi:hypothetical protein